MACRSLLAAELDPALDLGLALYRGRLAELVPHLLAEALEDPRLAAIPRANVDIERALDVLTDLLIGRHSPNDTATAPAPSRSHRPPVVGRADHPAITNG